MPNTLLRHVIILAILSSFTVFADELTHATQKMCQKVRACSLAHAERQHFSSPDMKQFVESAIEGVCDMMTSQTRLAKQHGLYHEAVACLNETLNMTCEQFEEGIDGPACTQLQQKALGLNKETR
ncbi:hypothetical protein OE749_09760 [Aestuariibacter sp. AA17]|uniref:Uncharacterized protein n=1 Tax=Fluctibacter corallii TaxID=2984329 RepID=A0ABT3A8I0_9ALTE|nr:hypothetical protein [Aestuariibacter sp. AA17]MCV2884981.1 hypothetical protein [Aestuariibacter sp. AA17]